MSARCSTSQFVPQTGKLTATYVLWIATKRAKLTMANVNQRRQSRERLSVDVNSSWPPFAEQTAKPTTTRTAWKLKSLNVELSSIHPSGRLTTANAKQHPSKYPKLNVGARTTLLQFAGLTERLTPTRHVWSTHSPNVGPSNPLWLSLATVRVSNTEKPGDLIVESRYLEKLWKNWNC